MIKDEITTVERTREVYKVTIIGTILNVVLIILKFISGFVGRSSAMVADAVHSLSDLVTDLIVLIFVKIAGKPRDRSHEYGHGKFETFATMVIGIILAGAGIGLLVGGVRLVVECLGGKVLPRPTMFALVIAVVSIVSKEILFRYTMRRGKELNSNALKANAWHHRSDAISSVGTLIGIGGAMFFGERLRILDPVAAIVVSFFIIKSGYDIMRPSIDELLEASLPPEIENEIRRVALSVEGVEGIGQLLTRRIGSDIAIDMHLKMNGDISLDAAHVIATNAERVLKENFGSGTLVTIHMEPTVE